MAYIKDYTTGRETSQPVTFEQSLASVYKNMYGWMTCALALTALTAFVVMDWVERSSSAAAALYNPGSLIGFVIASIAIVLFLSARIRKISLTTAMVMFAIYSVIMGIWTAPVLLIYTSASVTQVFLITAGTFGGMALYGHYTNADLSSMGRILIMALWGVILASLVNLFMHNSMMQYIISYASVAIFVGLTAYDTQKFKQMILGYEGEADEMIRKVAVIGALNLYLDFLNLFLHLLQLLGKRK